MNAVSLSVASVAGALAVINPCAFPLLPAFLSFYVGADEQRLPRAATRVLQGVVVGTLVTAGFLGLFAAAGLPIVFGIGAVSRIVPWAGLTTGIFLTGIGILTFCGRSVRAPIQLRVRARRERRVGAMVVFGVAYGAASLGCSLPIFLSVVGAALGGGKVVAFGAYGLGMAVVLLTISVSIALLREGLVRHARGFLPHVARATGLLLVVSGGYLTYYWARIQFGDKATLANDPILTFVTVQATRLQEASGAPTWPLAVAATAVATAAMLSTVRNRRNA